MSWGKEFQFPSNFVQCYIWGAEIIFNQFVPEDKLIAMAYCEVFCTGNLVVECSGVRRHLNISNGKLSDPYRASVITLANKQQRIMINAIG